MKTVIDIDQLCGDPDLVARTSDATLEHRVYVELLTDGTDIFVAILEGER